MFALAFTMASDGKKKTNTANHCLRNHKSLYPPARMDENDIHFTYITILHFVSFYFSL